MNAVSVTFVFTFLLVGSQVSSFILSPEISDEEATRTCVSELNLDESTITTLDVIENYDESNPSCGKLLSCTWKKLGLQNADGNVNFDKLKKYLTDFTQKRVDAGLSKTAVAESVVNSWLEGCRSLQAADHGQTALKVHFCVADAIKKHIKSHT